jgi:hypothetical protein
MEKSPPSASETNIKLEWSRLLGFDQAVRSTEPAAGLSDQRLSKLGAKVGNKPGIRSR